MKKVVNVKNLDREAVIKHLSIEGTVVFHYLKNVHGFAFLLVASAIFVGIGLLVYHTNQLSLFWLIVVFAVFFLPPFMVTLSVLFWNRYADIHQLAISKNWLYVGKNTKGHCVQWSALTLENTGFEQITKPGLDGVLKIRVDQKKINLRLFNPFVYIDNLPDFIAYLLTRIKENGELGDEAPDD